MKYRCRASEAGSVEAGRPAAHRFFCCWSCRWGIRWAAKSSQLPGCSASRPGRSRQPGWTESFGQSPRSIGIARARQVVPPVAQVDRAQLTARCPDPQDVE